MKVIFAHGMESSPEGTKATYLKEKFNAIVPWLGELNMMQQIDSLRRAILPDDTAVVVGSSLGALAAIGLALESPGRIHHLVLLAPAVGFERHEKDREEIEARRPGLFEQCVSLSARPVPRKVITTIIHGMEDEVIELDDVINLSRRSKSARLILVHDDHSLHKSRDLILSVVEKVIKGSDILAGVY